MPSRRSVASVPPFVMTVPTTSFGRTRPPPPVRHARPADELRPRAARAREGARREREDDVAVVQLAGRVGQDQPVAVAVEGEADVRAALDHRALEALGIRAAAVVVDVEAVRRVAEGDDLGPGVGEHARRDPVGRAVPAVQHDAQARQVRRLGEQEVLVAAHQSARVADEADAALGRSRQGVIAGHELLDARLDRVRELEAALVEELDAVVRGRLVRGADHGSGDEPLGACQVGEAGGGHVPDEPHLHADRAEAGGEGALQHPAGAARVAPDDDTVALPAEDVARGAAQAEGELRREVAVRDPADPVSSEQARHQGTVWMVVLVIVTVTCVGCTDDRSVPDGTEIATGRVYVPGPRPATSTDAVTDAGPSAVSVGTPPPRITLMVPGVTSAATSGASPSTRTATSGKGREPTRAITVTATVASEGPTVLTPVGRSSATVKVRAALSPPTSTGAVSIFPSASTAPRPPLTVMATGSVVTRDTQ